MKKDPLEKFVDDHKEEFDSLDVPTTIWNNLDRTLNPPATRKTFRLYSYAWKAAAAILIFVSAWYLNDYMDRRPEGEKTADVSTAVITNPELIELSDAEAYYSSQISNRQTELERYTQEHPEILEDLKKEFRELDIEKLQLRKELAESNADEKVIEAIIQSYKIKLEILEEMLAQLQQVNQPDSITTTQL